MRILLAKYELDISGSIKKKKKIYIYIPYRKEIP